ncbi:BREX system ATP-binding protein BrxD [Dietzia aurantiaca]|uniref:BREX system ATP-binding protein BrxD n=1 Tax=Dietzia aurantiaca TaxID=983873 RepID=A0ABV9PMB4_9ACTN
MSISPARRTAIIDALRKGTVPAEGLDQLAVGLDRLAPILGEELDKVASGSAVFKAVRGEYGSGKTFFARWLQQQAIERGFAVAEVQISELETPLHRLETVYRRACEELRTAAVSRQAFRAVLDDWLLSVEDDAADSAGDAEELLEERLRPVAEAAPVFPLALRGYRAALLSGETETADGLAAWLGGQRNVAASAKRAAGVKGELDHFLAMGFFQGLLQVLDGSGHSGLLLVLDEVETLQRMRGDVREKALNALRQWIDELDSGRYPGMYLLITGTTAFFEGRQGIKRLPPLDQRIGVRFDSDPRFDNPRQPQIRLQAFDFPRLIEVGTRVRELYVTGISDDAAARITRYVDDDYLRVLAESVAGKLGGQVGIAPRQYLRMLVDVMDRVEMFADFVPREHFTPTLESTDLSENERSAAASSSSGSLDDPDDIEL